MQLRAHGGSVFGQSVAFQKCKTEEGLQRTQFGTWYKLREISTFKPKGAEGFDRVFRFLELTQTGANMFCSHLRVK
jgi:hypothetical protein